MEHPVAPATRHLSFARILVVEDDDDQALALEIGLGREQMAVEVAHDGREAIMACDRQRFDLILLDVVLPGISGLDVCRELRARGAATPIIMVSSRSEEVDVVVGMEVGADDYVVKPFRLRELVARINALLRRQRSAVQADPSRPQEEAVLRVGDVVLDSSRHEVLVRGTPIELPLREFQLLQELLWRSGRVVTREQLLEAVWGIDYEGDPRIVATLVGRLRARIEEDPEVPTHIVTIRGVGYRFNDRAGPTAG